MSPYSPLPSRDAIRVVLSSTALQPLATVWRAAALAIAQLGIAAFFVGGIARLSLGDTVVWFVLVAALLAVLARAVDLESWGLLVPGGFAGRLTRAFGPRAAGVAAAIGVTERLLLGTLACVVAGHYAAASAATVGLLRFTGSVRPEDLATVVAAATIGTLWISVRIGRDADGDALADAVWAGTGLLALLLLWALVTLAVHPPAVDQLTASLTTSPRPLALTGWVWPDRVLGYLLALGTVLTVVGGGEAVAQAARELPPPRVHALRRTVVLTLYFGFGVTVLGTVLAVILVPAAEQAVSPNAPLMVLAQHAAGSALLRQILALLAALAAFLILVPAAYAALRDAERMFHRLSTEGALLSELFALQTRFGTPARAIDLTAAVMAFLILMSGSRVAWLARAYGFAMSAMLALTVAALTRLRRQRRDPSPFRAPMTLRLGGRELSLGLLLPGIAVGAAALAMLVSGDGAAVTVCAAIAGLALWLALARPAAAAEATAAADDTFDLLRAADLSPDQVEARPGSVLVPVRNPHTLNHVTAALRTSDDRDVVVMTVRLFDIDIGADAASEHAPTAYERRLFSDVVTLAERVGRPVRLVIVPARNVVDAIIGTAIRLRCSDIYVGESLTLSAADQARLLGEAWERADKPDALDVHLVIAHGSGRTDTYHLGAHPPSLTPDDLDLIHRLWLDAVKAVGPHVHHHDVVRAALKQMDNQLSGPDRDQAVAAIQEAARPAEELAGVLRTRDYQRLRDVLRNRHEGEVAELLADLPLEDQVIVFRVLPRDAAAAVFEYLDHDAKEALLKTMAHEDVAELLNNMAPDERTLFFEELPAEATRQMLALLTPAERAVAVKLLGYPEDSVGRLMTPHYVAVREKWTVREVLDYVRTNGRDSETLDVIYIVDDHGRLIDDVRIRELLLAPLDATIADLADRHFVALKAMDDQNTAVGVFREYDRTALPVTDSAGMLIGIVTIDDVLDVAEAAATAEIQRIGGSEALDEPYMEIGFWQMIRKRAGWLTALFIGEMLTATAMGVFEAEISRAVVLALFVPLIISSGGNSGSQASTLVIRALALGEVALTDWWRVMRREVLAGLALGAILGSIGFVRIMVWSSFSSMYGEHALLVAITVSVALVGVVLWGTLSGSLLPFLLKRLGFDPAASSAPFVATLVDVTGLVIYFSVALVVLKGTLL